MFATRDLSSVFFCASAFLEVLCSIFHVTSCRKGGEGGSLTRPPLAGVAWLVGSLRYGKLRGVDDSCRDIFIPAPYLVTEEYGWVRLVLPLLYMYDCFFFLHGFLVGRPLTGQTEVSGIYQASGFGWRESWIRAQDLHRLCKKKGFIGDERKQHADTSCTFPSILPLAAATEPIAAFSRCNKLRRFFCFCFFPSFLAPACGRLPPVGRVVNHGPRRGWMVLACFRFPLFACSEGGFARQFGPPGTAARGLF